MLDLVACLAVLREAEDKLKPPVEKGVRVHNWPALIALVNAVPSLREHLESL